jgi:putative N6-adenine-specific DNA methylase
MNPEYGERMGDVRQLESVYARIGDFLKQRCTGYRGYVFTGNLDLAKKIGLRTKRRMPFWNSGIECRLLEFDLYAGSKRATRAEGTSG